MDKFVAMTSDMEEKINFNDDIEKKYLTFFLGNENYGIGIRYVLQIIVMQDITQMPDMPHEMKGFINLRGSVIPVVSLRIKFDKPEVECNDRTCIIIIQLEGRDIGLIVDAINETIAIESEQISQAPSLNDKCENAYVDGIARLDDGNMVLLLDAEKLFANDEVY